jgi:hypothetical protein
LKITLGEFEGTARPVALFDSSGSGQHLRHSGCANYRRVLALSLPDAGIGSDRGWRFSGHGRPTHRSEIAHAFAARSHGGEEEVLDPRAELVNRLLEHEKFKAAAQMLWSRATVERAVFTRAEIETDKNNPEVVVGLFDLLKVFQEILARHKEEVLMEIEREEVTMAQMIERPAEYGAVGGAK